MRKHMCGQCSSTDGLQDSILPIRCKTGRVKIIGSPLCSTCRKQAGRVITRAARTGRLAV